MKTTEEYFQEFYNEVRYQIEQGAKANFTRANKIWAKYEASKSAQADDLATLRAQLAEAREIIEPFAAEAGMWGSKTSDGETPIIRGSDGKGDEAAFTVGDLRKAQKWYDKVTTA